MTVEPRVEDLLASIRKAIDDDLGAESTSTSGNSQGTLIRGALREMRVSYNGDGTTRDQADTEISKLRDRIGRSRIESNFTSPKLPVKDRLEPPLRPQQKGFSSILSGNAGFNTPPPALRQTLNDDAYPELPPIAEDTYAAPSWEEQEHYVDPSAQPYYAAEPYVQRQALVSPETAYAAQNSFQNLADTIMARAVGDRGLEDMTRDLLRGMIKTWLDDNLPDMVERLVREEIERVARRGR